MDLHFAHLAEHINPASSAFQHSLSTLTARYSAMGISDPGSAAMKTITDMVTRESTMIAFNDVHLAMAGVFLLMLLLVPLVKAPTTAVSPTDGH